MKWLNRLLLLLILGMAVYVVASHGGLYDLWQIKKNIAQLEKKNTALLQEKNDLATQINLLKSNYFIIEKLAREELGMVKKDDLVIYFDKHNASPAPQVSNENNEKK
jgi:cell division protein FtsB